MTKKYNQLTQEQRYKIEALICAGKKQFEIASIIGVSKSTISRELNRNIPKRGRGALVYVASKAQHKTNLRHKFKPKRMRFNDWLKKDMLSMMKDLKYSPELISAEWKLRLVDGVSHETMYRFIWSCKHTNKRINQPFKNIYKLLKHGKRKRKRGNCKDSRGLIPNRISIEKRPSIVLKRKRLGDFEADFIIGENHKSALLVTIDRASLVTTINKVNGRDANQVKNKIIQRLQKYPNVRTITFDNDKAFALHQEIGKMLNCKTYFTRPYTSQDKGTIENRNGVIRLFFPKKTNFNKIHHSTIKSVENKINNRPVRKFNYLTPNQIALQLKI
jgi:IS30 family transposase